MIFLSVWIRVVPDGLEEIEKIIDIKQRVTDCFYFLS
jgi:hypothetical protein